MNMVTLESININQTIETHLTGSTLIGLSHTMSFSHLIRMLLLCSLNLDAYLCPPRLALLHLVSVLFIILSLCMTDIMFFFHACKCNACSYLTKLCQTHCQVTINVTYNLCKICKNL